MQSIDEVHKAGQYKAVSPEETIQKIRNILFENRIFTVEKHWSCQKDFLASVRIEVAHTCYGANGKGIDLKFALASAYAELMERIQNNSRLKLEYPDTQPVNPGHLKKKHPGLFKELLGDNATDQCHCKGLPFCHLNSNSIVSIPFLPLIQHSGTNGFCAGNTPEEAILQGLCEIFERFLLKMVYLDKIPLPTVPRRILKRLPQWKFITHLISKGYQVIVKDCSLGGIWPVAGVILLKNDRGLFKLGAYPNFSISLERCMTELLQGKNMDGLEKALLPLDKDEFLKIINDTSILSFEEYQLLRAAISSGMVPAHLLAQNNEDCAKKFVLEQDADGISKRKLKQYTTRLKNNGYDIYLRDNSFLGFPAYRIYIPEMSTFNALKKVKNYMGSKTELKQILLTIDTADTPKLLSLIDCLERFMNMPHITGFPENAVELILDIKINGSPHPPIPDTAVFVSYLYFRIHQIKKAYLTLNRFFKETLIHRQKTGANHSRLQTYFILLTFFEKILNGELAPDEWHYLASKLPEKDPLLRLLQRKLKIAAFFSIPTLCYDCHRCEKRLFCNYEEINRLKNVLAGKMQTYHFDQRQLLKRLTA